MFRQVQSCFSRSVENQNALSGALSNLVVEVLTLAALAGSLARLQESPAPLALMASLVDAKPGSGFSPGHVETARRAFLQLGGVCGSSASGHALK